MSLNGVNVLVAGGCGLIGYELVIQIIDYGANVIIGDNYQELGKNLIDNLPEANSCYIQLDITDANSVDQAIAVG